MSAPVVEFIEIKKSFFAAAVLRGISFSVPEAGAVGLVGENGAGKSTLMNILGGNLAPDSGGMRFNGADYKPASPKDAERHGIAFIHQELNLFPNLSIAENLFLTRFPRRNGLINRPLLEQETSKLLKEVGLDKRPTQSVETLSTGERQLVEIAKALSIQARLIIFDEPTTSLSQREANRLFALIERLRSRGIGFIYISHALRDVARLCDELVVLRDGAVVGQGSAASFPETKLVSLMVGREINQLFPTRDAPKVGEPLLDVRQLSRGDKLDNISFTLRAGEIVGLGGLMGAGRSELARSIFGLDPRTSGEVRLSGRSLKRLRPRDAVRSGVAFLTENRGAEGLCLSASVAENLTLAALPRYARAPFRLLRFRALQSAVDRIRAVVNLDAKVSNAQAVRTLSGGNQQKVVFGKWLLNTPQVLILDEPTRGIDVGAKAEVYRLISELANNGGAALVISSEIEELIGLCDRVLILRRGALVREFQRSEFNREEMLRAALGTT